MLKYYQISVVIVGQKIRPANSFD